MQKDYALVFQEFVMGESLPLAAIHAAVLEFLRGRDDVAVFGAQAVNAYVNVPRMTQDVDIMAVNGAEFSEQLREHLHQNFDIAVRVRTVAGGNGFRIYQVRSPANRHLVDVRDVPVLPACQRIGDVLVVTPVELLALKVISISGRPGTAKALTDEADALRLLLMFPELKQQTGPVTTALQRAGATEQARAVWQSLVMREIAPEDDED